MPERNRHLLEVRLARSEGPVHAVHRMAHEGRSYPEIVHQISAPRTSLDAAVRAIDDDLVRSGLHDASGNEAGASTVEALPASVAGAP
jgi:DNA-binding FrmR family transcriptional regulator